MRAKFGLARSLAVLSSLVIVAAIMAPAQVGASPTKCSSGNPCKLVFVSQPADAVANTTVTASRFNPSGAGIAVQIQFLDGSAASGNVGDHILLTPQPVSTNTGTCSGLSCVKTGSTDPVIADATGTATFTNLALNTHGRYTLQATDQDSTKQIVAAATSSGFNLWDTANPCSGLCQNGLGGPHEAGTVTTTAGDGTLVTVLGAYNKTTFLSSTCNSASYVATFPKNFKPAFGPNVGDIELLDSTNPGIKTVSVTYDKAYVHNAGLASSSYTICFESTAPFQDFQNNTSPQEGTSGVYYGLLPGPCGSTSTPFSQANPVGGPAGDQPCLLSNPSASQGAVTVTFQLPADDKFCC